MAQHIPLEVAEEEAMETEEAAVAVEAMAIVAAKIAVDSRYLTIIRAVVVVTAVTVKETLLTCINVVEVAAEDTTAATAAIITGTEVVAAVVA